VNIHEFQGKALFRESGIAVQDGVHCTNVEQALAAYDSLGSEVVAVKSQIHAGGRGKGSLYAPGHWRASDGGRREDCVFAQGGRELRLKHSRA